MKSPGKHDREKDVSFILLQISVCSAILLSGDTGRPEIPEYACRKNPMVKNH